MKQSRSIYIISFFEGAAVMATELCGSKLVSPYFGSSLYVWASVIAVTLGSLAAGYFYGGRLSLRDNKAKILFMVLIASAAYMGLMPMITNLFAPIAIGLPFTAAVVLSGTLLLFLPMFLMGAASPLIISIQTVVGSESGKVSGLVYSISTVGGILSTFVCGFLFIPGLGINTTLIIFALLLAASLLLLLQKKSNYTVISVLFILVILGFTNSPPKKNCIFQKDGMLGNIQVIDDTLSADLILRRLMVNSIIQTEINLIQPNEYYVSHYIMVLDSNFNYVNEGKALVLGLGGGITANMFLKKNYAVTGVEFDETIIGAAKEYFFMDARINAVCDDARHFVNQTADTYDVILMDLFKAEEQPSHVVTQESFEKVRSILSKNGRLVINWHGYSKGQRGMGTAVLLNTLKKSGYNFRLASFKTNEDERNLVIFASVEPLPPLEFEIADDTEPTSLVNSDSRPLMEKYNAEANQSWRKNYILYYYSGN
jgi:predicted membrane-bound spermidine synthase